MPDEHKPTAAAPAGAGSGSSWRCCSRSTGCSVLLVQPSGAAAGQGPVQPVLPAAGPGRAGEVDLLEGRHDPGDVHAARSSTRPASKKAKPTTLFSTQVPDVLGQHRADRAAPGEGRRGQREEPEPRHVAAGRAPARVRPDPAPRRPLLFLARAGAVGGGGLGGLGQLRAVTGAPRRPDEDPGHL